MKKKKFWVCFVFLIMIFKIMLNFLGILYKWSGDKKYFIKSLELLFDFCRKIKYIWDVVYCLSDRIKFFEDFIFIWE